MAMAVRPCLLLKFPASDIIILAFAAGSAVSAVRDDIKLIMHSGTEIDIIVFPGVLGYLSFLQVSAFPPSVGAGTGFRLGNKSLQTLRGKRITADIQLIKVKCR